MTSTANGINVPNTLPGDGTFVMWANEHSFSSFHPGGAHFLMVDSSVQFISENIDADVLFALTTRAGGDVISAEDW